MWESTPRHPLPFGSRLRPEEIDAIVNSLQDVSMFDLLFRYAVRAGLLVIGWILLLYGKRFEALFGALLLTAGAGTMLFAWIRSRR